MTRKWFGTAAAAITCAATLFGMTAPVFARQATPSPKPGMMKKMPMRDSKGRFMKASPAPSKTHMMPMRDAKGHFMKAPAKMKTAKTMPMRDSKGRFMKASPKPGMMPK